jgi:hypothetical protein
VVGIVGQKVQHPVFAEHAALVLAQVRLLAGLLLCTGIDIEHLEAGAIERAIVSNEMDVLLVFPVEPAADVIERAVLEHEIDDMLDLRAHEIDGAWEVLARGVNREQRLDAGEHRLGIEPVRQHARSQRPGQRVGALGIEPPQTVAAVARDPIEDKVADGDELVALVDILPGSGLHRGLRQR